MIRVHRTLRVHFDKGSSREETFLGREYFVVPCVAMVEGVRFGANQDSPELGLASEFGEVPIAWANRPLVLNHPQVDGEFVSANSPSVLEDYCFGMTMNPTLDDTKLKMEAWIDIDRVTTLKGQFKDTYDRIKAEEDVEISVGFFSDIEKKSGKFKGQVYGAIWRNIKPDHLAILTEGLIGACSVDDGCGIPRVNKDGTAMPEPVLKTNANKDPKAQCSCGGDHTVQEHNATGDAVADDEPVTQGGLKKLLSDMLKPFTQTKAEKDLELHINSGKRAANEAIVNQIDSTLMDSDIRAMISRALKKEVGNYVYLLGYTKDYAIYENYNSDYYTYACYQIGINVSDSDVKFTGEPQEVILQTKIVPQTSATQEKDMTTADAAKPAATTTQEAAKPAATVVVVETPKVQTAEEYIAAAPPAIRDMMSAALKAQTEKKATAIKTLTDAKTTFTKEWLETQTIDVLEGMVAMLPGTFKGVAPATQVGYSKDGKDTSETVPLPKIQWNKPHNQQDKAA